MPLKCCVPCCRSNYRGTPYVTCFRFPKDPDAKEKWLMGIRRANFEPNYTSVVCAKHFAQQHIITHDELPSREGPILIARGKPRLTLGACPSIFQSSEESSEKIVSPQVSGFPENMEVKIEKDDDLESVEVNDFQSVPVSSSCNELQSSEASVLESVTKAYFEVKKEGQSSSSCTAPIIISITSVKEESASSYTKEAVPQCSSEVSVSSETQPALRLPASEYSNPLTCRGSSSESLNSTFSEIERKSCHQIKLSILTKKLETYHEQVESATEMNAEYRRKVRRLSQKIRRQQKTIDHLKTVLSDLKYERLANADKDMKIQRLEMDHVSNIVLFKTVDSNRDVNKLRTK